MKKNINSIFGFILIAVLAYTAWVAITFILNVFFNSLKSLNQNQTTLLIALVPSSISIAGIVFSNNLQKQKELEFKNRERKERAYDAFLKTNYEFINQKRSGKTDDQLMVSVTKARKDLVLWGSDKVVKLYSEFMAIVQEQSDENPDKNSQINIKLEQILLAIRKDLGYKNNKLTFGDLLRYFR